MSELALVTGACSGIGLAIARELKARGYRLLLVSNRQAELSAVAQELGAESFVIDLARPEAAGELIAEVERRGAQVDVLVNNAGFFFFGEVADADPRRANAMLQLHVVTPTLLARHFAARMRERRRGHLLFTSSISAWRSFPGIALYGSTKRYLLDFATALRSELRPWGVNVTVVAPGATATGLYDPTVVPVELATRVGVMVPPAFVAKKAVDAMLARRGLSIPGLLSKLFAWGAAVTPQWLVDLIRRRAPWLPMPDRRPA
ncbi:MAG: SDR family NAD(P)-dependent oxidoreductase [Myxococcota bacterium]